MAPSSSGKDAWFSAKKPEFESPWGHSGSRREPIHQWRRSMKRLLPLVFVLLMSGTGFGQVVTSETTTTTTRTYETPVVESTTTVVTSPTVITTPPVVVAPRAAIVAPYATVRFRPRRAVGIAFPGYAVYPW